MEKITALIDCKRPEWRHHLDNAIAAGNARNLRGETPDGLPPGGRWEYRRRAAYGRVYLAYILPDGKMHTIGSVAPEHAEASLKWKPRPNSERIFEFETGTVKVRYDEHALPCHICGV